MLEIENTRVATDWDKPKIKRVAVWVAGYFYDSLCKDGDSGWNGAVVQAIENSVDGYCSEYPVIFSSKFIEVQFYPDRQPKWPTNLRIARSDRQFNDRSPKFVVDYTGIMASRDLRGISDFKKYLEEVSNCLKKEYGLNTAYLTRKKGGEIFEARASLVFPRETYAILEEPSLIQQNS